MDLRTLFVFFFNIHAVMLTGCSKVLGARSKTHSFTCDAVDRKNAYLEWYRNGTQLSVSNKMKYKCNHDRTRLELLNIDHGDEGNYSCKYMDSSSSNITLFPGCIYVYGAANFASEEKKIYVTGDGTVKFDLSLSFTQPGPRGLRQLIDRFRLRNSSNFPLVEYSTDGSSRTFQSNIQWWTVEANYTMTVEEHRYDVTFTLHQTLSKDLESYTAEVVGSDPSDSNGESDLITSLLEVRGNECDQDPPIIDSTVGRRSILESTSTDIVGNQANYSCSGNCILQGSSSLRCRRVTMGVLNSDVEWVNESGNADPPSCLCPETSITPTSISPSTSIHHKTSNSIDVSLLLSKVEDSKKPNGLSAAGVGIITAVTVGILVLIVSLFLAIIILWKFHSRGTRGSKGQVVSDKREVVLRQNDHIKTSQNSSLPHSFSDDRVSFIEKIDNELFSETVQNSHAIDV